jgi:hypothetical protein
MEKTDVIVVDNFVTPTYSTVLYNDSKQYLQYCYIEKTSKPDHAGRDYDAGIIDENTYDSGQFVCPIFDHEHPPGAIKFDSYSLFLKPLIYTMRDTFPDYKLDTPMRIKVNLLLKQETFPVLHYNVSHIDNIHEDKWSIVYYLNDSDGDTFLFNEFKSDSPDKLTVFKRITPKKNRAVLFNSSRYHASSNPKINSERLVINIVMETYK